MSRHTADLGMAHFTDIDSRRFSADYGFASSDSDHLRAWHFQLKRHGGGHLGSGSVRAANSILCVQPCLLSLPCGHAKNRFDFLLRSAESWFEHCSKSCADALVWRRRNRFGYIALDHEYVGISLVLELEGSGCCDQKNRAQIGRNYFRGARMIPKPTQYLLRFDDICPTMSHSGWDRFRPMIEEFSIRPILAVVPDNRDPDLMVSPRDSKFWNRMRSMEAAGATIAVHGYQHLCKSRGKSLLGLHRETEFAGVCKEQQREWVRAGLRILRGQGLNPRLWVAPRHGFDENTLHALREEGIEFISDGLARRPLSRGGVTWIPQQLW